MKKWAAIYLFFLALFVAYWLLYAVAPDFHEHCIQGEDRLVEWLTFLGFLGASLLAFSALRFRKKMHRFAQLYIFMTALFFFVCAGEEISWGQRVFGFDTPNSMQKTNEQGEFNLHNMNFEHIHPSDLVSLYMKGFGIFIPLVLAWKMRPANSPLRLYLSAPELIPCYIFPEMLHLVRFMTQRLASQCIRPAAAYVVESQNEEVLEMYWGFCVLLSMWWIRRAWSGRPSTTAEI